jgi:hypothetical protein
VMTLLRTRASETELRATWPGAKLGDHVAPLFTITAYIQILDWMGTVFVRETVTKIEIKEVVWHVQAVVREIMAGLEEVLITAAPVVRVMSFA